jgi:hypothetical protein
MFGIEQDRVSSLFGWTVLTAVFCLWLANSATADNTRPATSRPLTAAEIQQKQAKMKADMERRLAETKRKHDELAKRLQPGQDQLREDAARYLQRHERTPPPPFNATAAPSPSESLQAFIAAAKNASSMEQLMPYLPHNEMETLKARQSMYDPREAAQGRDRLRKQNPKLSDEELTHLSNPPYTNALKFKKGLADDIRDILSVKVDGDKASLVVSTNNGATINGERYPYGEADVEMIGEGNAWKLSRFRQSIIYHKEPPLAPK